MKKTTYPENFDELLKSARERPLLPEALKQFGVELKPVGHGHGGSVRWQTTTKSGRSGDLSSVVFFENPDGSWVAFDNKQRSGKSALDAIGVLTNLFAVPFDGAVYMLTGGSPTLPPRTPTVPSARPIEPVKPKEVVFRPPVKAESDRHVFAYLTKSRLIPADTVSNLLRIGAIYEGNIKKEDGKELRNLLVFPIKNEKKEMVGADCCGTWSSVRFKHIVEGSDPVYAWRIFNHTKEVSPDTRLFFCESAIDAISFLCLTNAPGVYLSMCGLKDETFEHMQKILGGKPILCVDNDEAGNRFRKKYPSCETLYPQNGKDWNDELKYRVLHDMDYALKPAAAPQVKPACV